MDLDPKSLATLIAKDQIRDLVLLYSRGVDRKDGALLRSLYTHDGIDDHGKHFSGSAADYVDFLEKSFPFMWYSGHHVCNHLISIISDTEAEGEVYALAYHLIPDGKGGAAEDFMAVRYIDRYRKDDGKWLFAKRVVSFDLRSVRPAPTPEGPELSPSDDPSFAVLTSRLFARGPRGA